METGRGVSRDDRAPRPRPAVHRGHGGDEPGRAARLARAPRRACRRRGRGPGSPARPPARAAPARAAAGREGARRLEVSVDTVRAKGAEWGIEVYLGEGLYRYDPAQV